MSNSRITSNGSSKSFNFPYSEDLEEFKKVLKNIDIPKNLNTWKSTNEITKDVEKRTKAEIENEGRAQYFKLQKTWSSNVFWVLISMVGFQFGIFIAIICMLYHKVVTYSDVSSILLLLAGENFGQIVGLAFLVVKFLFPKLPE